MPIKRPFISISQAGRRGQRGRFDTHSGSSRRKTKWHVHCSCQRLNRKTMKCVSPPQRGESRRETISLVIFVQPNYGKKDKGEDFLHKWCPSTISYLPKLSKSRGGGLPAPKCTKNAIQFRRHSTPLWIRFWLLVHFWSRVSQGRSLAHVFGWEGER